MNKLTKCILVMWFWAMVVAFFVFFTFGLAGHNTIHPIEWARKVSDVGFMVGLWMFFGLFMGLIVWFFTQMVKDLK